MSEHADDTAGATPAGTRAYRDRRVACGLDDARFRALGRTGLVVGAVGFGGYRIHDSVEEHQLALETAFRAGCNLVDTATNYGDGASERLIGKVLTQPNGRLPGRAEMVVVSKVGFLQNTNLERARQRRVEGRGWSDLVHYDADCWHCIHPDFLADQIERSLARTGLSRMDVYLLHNPEYFLTAAVRAKETDVERTRAVFYERILRAFECLEGLADRGLIGWYGVSSNTLGAPESDPQATSLTRLLACAAEAGGAQHRFAVVECPLNLREPGPALTASCGQALKRTLLEEAALAEVAVLTNRPLNAVDRGKVVRLVEFAPPQRVAVARYVKAALRVEDWFAEGLGVALDFSAGDGDPLFRYAARLEAKARILADAVAFDEYVQHVFSPDLSAVVAQIDAALDGPLKAAWQIWLERYVDAMGELVEALHGYCARRSQRRSDKVSRVLDPALPAALRDAPLSRRAVAAVLAVDGVTAVLVGMRTRDYVLDVMRVMRWGAFELDPKVLWKTSAEVLE